MTQAERELLVAVARTVAQHLSHSTNQHDFVNFRCIQKALRLLREEDRLIDENTRMIDENTEYFKAMIGA